MPRGEQPDAGYVVLDTGDPQQAIRMATELMRVDLLLIDVVMPLMKGTQRALRFQSITPRLSCC